MREAAIYPHWLPGVLTLVFSLPVLARRRRLGSVSLQGLSGFKLEARGGIEPPIKVLQTFALPLGYRAPVVDCLMRRGSASTRFPALPGYAGHPSTCAFPTKEKTHQASASGGGFACANELDYLLIRSIHLTRRHGAAAGTTTAE